MVVCGVPIDLKQKSLIFYFFSPRYNNPTAYLTISRDCCIMVSISSSRHKPKKSCQELNEKNDARKAATRPLC